MTVGKSGFKSWSQYAITLAVAQHITLYPQLEVGVGHRASRGHGPGRLPYHRQQHAIGSYRIEQIQQLPLNGRNALQLQELEPGVVSTGTGGQFGAQQVTFTSSGGRDIDTNYTLDGGINVRPVLRDFELLPKPRCVAGIFCYQPQLQCEIRTRLNRCIRGYPLWNQRFSWIGV